jgi:DNA-binding transcriptional MerR regulator
VRTVSEVSELTGVTIRTLHHYDEIGLLAPSARSEAGYRLYSYDDLTRLQEVLGWRALGFSLAEVRKLLDDPHHDRGVALRRQRELIDHDIERLSATARALEAAIAAHELGTKLEEKTMFDGFDASEYEDEVRERWGHTKSYRESRRRTAEYGEQDWNTIRSEWDAILDDFVGMFEVGEVATGERARAVAERHRQHISKWFYPCSVQMHRGLGEMFVADERFARNYERRAPGLAVFVRDAIVANAEGAATAARG